MKITVEHANRDRQSGNVINFTAVAEVQIPVEISAFGTTDDCLEYAYRWTNNIEGSWSIKKTSFTLKDGNSISNGDYNNKVTVLKHREDGLGQRSSMMGDRFIADGVSYDCSPFGFKKSV
jgi:hypothetical protein